MMIDSSLKQDAAAATAQLTNQLDQLEEQFNMDNNIANTKLLLPSYGALVNTNAYLYEAATQESSMPSSQDSTELR